MSAPIPDAKDPRTTNEKLKALGLTTAPAGHHRKKVLKDGTVVVEGTAWEIECWIAGGGDL